MAFWVIFSTLGYEFTLWILVGLAKALMWGAGIRRDIILGLFIICSRRVELMRVEIIVALFGLGWFTLCTALAAAGQLFHKIRSEH